MNLVTKLRTTPIIERLLRLLPDSLYISLLYKKNVGVWPNLSNPKTFTEKIQWLKLHNRRPEFSIMVDKLLVKDYVAKRIGEQYIIPTLATWNRVEDIDVSKLPNQFVLKWNHDSGSIVICKDKTKFDIEEARRKLSPGQRKNGFWYGREWPYKNVKPVIIAEKYMEESTKPDVSDLTDYKFYCFNGEPRYCQVIRDRRTNETIDFYDMDWNHMPFVGLNPNSRNGLTPVPKPRNLDVMRRICSDLAKDMSFIRIDLYEINGCEYFGEITFYPASGFGVFTPTEWDKHLGDLINLKGSNMGGGKNSMS